MFFFCFILVLFNLDGVRYIRKYRVFFYLNSFTVELGKCGDGLEALVRDNSLFTDSSIDNRGLNIS